MSGKEDQRGDHIEVSGSGAATTHGGVAAGEGGMAVGGDMVYGDKVGGDKVAGDKGEVSTHVRDVHGGTVITAGRDVSIGQRITNFFLGSTEQQRAQRNRLAMLELVRNTWVKGVLEQSLHGAAMIELGLEERADAVERPWDTVLQMPDRPKRPLPPGTRIMDVFDETNRALLILGAPGSGKTTMLLELARDTITRAEKDPTQPIPVVFNLSSWAEKRQPIAEWLVDELNAKYHIPHRIARPWVDNDDLLLLLDGLDEVERERREACVKAINDFRQEHLMPLVVCSRIADFEALTTPLKLKGAILLQSLTPQQVDHYLEGAGTELLAVRKVLQHDTTLQELAQSPLMLSVMTLAYKGVPVEEMGALDTTEAARRHVFDAYVERMFKRRGVDRRYSPEQTIGRVGWLARKMTQHGQSIFLIDQLQPSWLATRTLCWVYILGSRLVAGLSIGVAVNLLGMWVEELLYGLRYGLIIGFSVGFIDLLRVERHRERISVEKDPTRGQAAINVLVVGLIVALIYGMLQWLTGWDTETLPCCGPLFWLLGGLFFGLRGSRQSMTSDIRTIETLRLSWRRAIKGGAVGVIIVMVVGLPIGLFIEALVVSWRRSPSSDLWWMRPPEYSDAGLPRWWVLYVILFALFFGEAVAMLAGLSGRVVETKTRPNQGIWFSLRSAILAGLIFGLPFGLIVVGLLGGRLGDGLLVGASIGLLAALWYGGADVMQHFVLRFILWRSGHVPWNYARFLDYAAERIFLRKVGGGYAFIHRLLQDYFAALGQG